MVFIVTGCATPPQTAQLNPDVIGVAPREELDQVPFHSQKRYQCGPAALAMNLNWSGVDLTPEDLVAEVYLPQRMGSLQLELIAATRRNGRIPYVINPELSDLIREVAAGHPVLVLQNLAFNWLPRWHYAVVVGYDLDAGVITLRSGTRRRHVIPLAVFERTWARGKHWALLTLPATNLPATAEPLAYLKAVAELERLGQWVTAEQAYRSALKQWTDQPLALLGLGNSLYQQARLEQAVLAYRRLINVYPDNAVAHHNLAETLFDLGQFSEAEQHAREALNLGGEWEESFRQTWQRIRASRAR